jgi:hypothetical protein
MHADCLTGQFVLESFAFHAGKESLQRYRPTWAGVMLDSGAFSVMQTGKPVDLEAYIDFALQRRTAYDAIVNLDVISGDVTERVDAGLRNLQRMRDAGLDPMPVFHQGEPWSVLGDLAAGGAVGVGMQRPLRGVETFLDGVFGRLGGGVAVHGFALANAKYTGRYPFDSVDSATWIREVLALMSLSGQGSDVMQYLTQAELVRLVVLKYQRLPRATAFAPPAQGDLFPSGEP